MDMKTYTTEYLLNALKERMHVFTTKDVLDYLKEQKDLESAIDNITALGRNLPYVACNDSGFKLFYFEMEGMSKTKLKERIYQYMVHEGWEKAEYCEDMDYDEMLDYFNLSIKQKKPK